jgi:hypothetical protein
VLHTVDLSFLNISAIPVGKLRIMTGRNIFLRLQREKKVREEKYSKSHILASLFSFIIRNP